MPTFGGLAYTFSQRGAPSSTPLILLHGAGGMSLSWPPQIRRLAGTTVITPDLPNHGKSSPYPFNILDEVASILLRWIDALQIPTVHLCGHSMGGAIGLLIALQAPQRVQKVILIGSAARLPVNPLLLELSAQASTLPQAIETLIKWSFAPSTPQRIKELTAQRLMENRPNSLYQDLFACNQFDVSDKLSQIQQPCLVLTGEHDRMTPVATAQTLAQGLPNAELEIIPDAGHMVVIEQPEQIAKRLWQFLHQPNPIDAAQ